MKRQFALFLAALCFSVANPVFAQSNNQSNNESNHQGNDQSNEPAENGQSSNQESGEETSQKQTDTAPPRQLTEAELAILMPGHMENIDEPMEIRYEFSKTGTYEQSFEDTVVMDVEKIHEDGAVTVDIHFFTGPHELPFVRPAHEEHIDVNTLIFLYLQADVYNMTYLTNRSIQKNFYFNRRILWALADNSTFTSEKIKVPFEGHQVEATRYTIQPYAKDPHRVDYDKFADKRYEFVMSEEVPGELYQIRTVIPNNIEKEAPPLIEETLTLVSAEPLPQTTAKTK